MSRHRSLRPASPRIALRVAATVLLAPLASAGSAEDATVADGTTYASDGSASPANDFAAGHGAVSIATQHLFLNGDWWDVGPKKPNGSVIVNSIDLGLDYFVADRWEVSVGIPFVTARYSGPLPHALEPLEVPHPHAVYVDDGDWHGTFADWTASVGYHATLDDYQLTPAVTVYVPSHSYSFYGAATVGEDIKRVGIGVSLAHQFEFSGLYFDAHYQYVVAEETLGIRPNYNSFGGDIGYFIKPAMQLRAFTDFKIGSGATDSEIGEHCPPCTDEFWYEHDKFRLEDHINVGAAFEYDWDRYSLTTSVQRMVWGKDNLNLKYGVDARLTRSF